MNSVKSIPTLSEVDQRKKQKNSKAFGSRKPAEFRLNWVAIGKQIFAINTET